MVFVPRKLASSGKREAKYFPSKSQAIKFIKDFRSERQEHGKSGVTAQQREWIRFAQNELGGNLGLLPEVIRHWKRTGEVLSRIATDDAVKEFLNSATRDYPNHRTLNDIKERLAKFRAAFSGRQVHEISTTDIEHFLERSSAGWDRWSVHKRLGPFWKFALRRKWTAVNPLAEIPTPKTPTPERLIYTPEQFQSMLWLAETDYPSLLPFVTLAGFAFLRTAELVGMYANEQILRWSDVHWDAGLIHVRPGVAKGTRRGSGDERYTPLTDAARSWLEPIKKESGPCVAMGAKKFGELWREMTDVAKVPRIDNGLRHSAISYSLAANPEHGVALTSQWAGNSEKTICKHYRRLIAPSLGKAWFSVRHHADVTVTYHQPGEETPF
jgi:integrase